MDSFIMRKYKNTSSNDLSQIINHRPNKNILINEKTPNLKKYNSKFILPKIRIKIRLQKSIWKDHPNYKSIKLINTKMNIFEVKDNLNKSSSNNDSNLKINLMMSGCLDITKINPPMIPNKCKKNELNNKLLKKFGLNKSNFSKNKIQDLILSQKAYNIKRKSQNKLHKSNLKKDAMTSTYDLKQNFTDVSFPKNDTCDNLLKHFKSKTNKNDFIKSQKFNANHCRNNYKTIKIIQIKNGNDENKNIDKNNFVDPIATETSYIIGKSFCFISNTNKKINMNSKY